MKKEIEIQILVNQGRLKYDGEVKLGL